jgi:hypothetical protein
MSYQAYEGVSQEDRIKELLELSGKIHDIANSFAIENKGQAAVMLHESANYTTRAIRKLEGKPVMDALEQHSHYQALPYLLNAMHS